MKTTGYSDDNIPKHYIKQSQPMYRPRDNKENELPLVSIEPQHFITELYQILQNYLIHN